MKRCIAIVMLLLILAAGCGDQAVESFEKYEIVVVPMAWSDDVDAQVRDHVAGREQINVYQNTSEKPDGLYQALLIEDLMAQEVDAICVEVVDAALAQPMIDKARDAGIVVFEGNDFCAMIDQAEAMLKNA